MVNIKELLGSWRKKKGPPANTAVQASDFTPITDLPTVVVALPDVKQVHCETEIQSQKQALQSRLASTRREVKTALVTKYNLHKANRAKTHVRNLNDTFQEEQSLAAAQEVQTTETGMVRLAASYDAIAALTLHHDQATPYLSGLVREGYNADYPLLALDVADAMTVNVTPNMNLFGVLNADESINPIEGFTFMMNVLQYPSNPELLHDSVAHTNRKYPMYQQYPALVEQGLVHLGNGLTELYDRPFKDINYAPTTHKGFSPAAKVALLYLKSTLNQQSACYMEALFDAPQYEDIHNEFVAMLTPYLQQLETRDLALKILGVTELADLYELYRRSDVWAVQGDIHHDFYLLLKQIAIDEFESNTSYTEEIATGDSTEVLQHHQVSTKEEMLSYVYTPQALETITGESFWSDFRSLADEYQHQLPTAVLDITQTIDNLGYLYGFKKPDECLLFLRDRIAQLELRYRNEKTKTMYHVRFSLNAQHDHRAFDWSLLDSAKPPQGDSLRKASMLFTRDVIENVYQAAIRSKRDAIQQAQLAEKNKPPASNGKQKRQHTVDKDLEPYRSKRNHVSMTTPIPTPNVLTKPDKTRRYPPLVYDRNRVKGMISDFGTAQTSIQYKIETYGQRTVGTGYKDLKDLESTINGCNLKRIRVGDYRILLINQDNAWQVLDVDLRSVIYTKWGI